MEKEKNIIEDIEKNVIENIKKYASDIDDVMSNRVYKNYVEKKEEYLERGRLLVKKENLAQGDFIFFNFEGILAMLKEIETMYIEINLLRKRVDDLEKKYEDIDYELDVISPVIKEQMDKKEAK